MAPTAKSVQTHNEARARAEALRPIFVELAGKSANAIAAELNKRGVGDAYRQPLVGQDREPGAEAAGGGSVVNMAAKAVRDQASVRARELAPILAELIDTQSRTMDGDENSSKDGAAYAKAIERIREATDAVVWIIAHTGHDGEKQGRPRGSSTLIGAYDVFYNFKKISNRGGEITITIDRDGLAGMNVEFDLELYDSGVVNEDGEPV